MSMFWKSTEGDGAHLTLRSPRVTQKRRRGGGWVGVHTQVLLPVFLIPRGVRKESDSPLRIPLPMQEDGDAEPG